VVILSEEPQSKYICSSDSNLTDMVHVRVF